jgi:hypothetical protein
MELKPIECPRCKTFNPSDSKYCSNCSMILDAETAMKLDNLIETNDDFLRKIVESRIDEMVEDRINEKLKTMNNEKQ